MNQENVWNLINVKSDEGKNQEPPPPLKYQKITLNVLTKNHRAIDPRSLLRSCLDTKSRKIITIYISSTSPKEHRTILEGIVGIFVPNHFNDGSASGKNNVVWETD